MKEKTSSLKQYSFTYLALMLLLGLTFLLSRIDLKGFNTIASLVIAAAKAILVAIYFMHLRSSAGLQRVFAVVGIFWLGILMTLSLSDYISRGWLMLPGHWPP